VFVVSNLAVIRLYVLYKTDRCSKEKSYPIHNLIVGK